MKKTIIAVLVGLAASAASAAVAREGSVGLGLTLGDPTGITAKYWFDDKSAVDVAAAWSLDGDSFNLHADYLLHSFDKMKGEDLDWAYHYGIGARVRFPDNNNHHHNNDNTTLGVRVPLGLDFYPSKSPLELFVEIAPVIDLVPESNFDLEFGVGARYYF